MKRKSIITLITPSVETWGNFKKMCTIKKLPYHSLKTHKFIDGVPLIYKDFTIYKTEFN